MSSAREHSRLEVDDRYHCKLCGVELPTMLVDGPIAGGDTEHPPVELCGDCEGDRFKLAAAALTRRRKECCELVPNIDPEHIDEHSIGYTGDADPDGMYAHEITFEAYGRHFELLDKDGDETAEYAFSYGKGPEWCVDHEEIPADVIEHVCEFLTPVSLEIDPDLVGGRDE